MPITLDDILPGDVILTARHIFERDSSFIKLANFFNNGLAYKDWTHAAFYIGNGQIVEACTDGVKTSDLQKKYLDNDYEIVVLRHKNASSAQLQIALDFCKSATGDKYDWRGLTYFLLYNFIPLQFHFILENDFIGSMFHAYNSYFCSELVATGFQTAGIYCFEWDPYKVLPIEFYNELLFKVVGKIGPEKPPNNWLWITYLATSLICIVLTFLLMIAFGSFVLGQWMIYRFKK